MMLKPRESEIYVTHLPVFALQRWVSGMSKGCREVAECCLYKFITSSEHLAIFIFFVFNALIVN